MTSILPVASDLCLRGDVSLYAMSLPQPPLGESRHLWLTVKHGGHPFYLNEGLMNSRARLAGVAMGTLRKDVKAHPQQEGSKIIYNNGHHSLNNGKGVANLPFQM
jgi:hypothetical protein